MLQRSHHNVHFNSFLGQNKENMQGCAQFWLFDVYSGEQPETLILRILTENLIIKMNIEKYLMYSQGIL